MEEFEVEEIYEIAFAKGYIQSRLFVLHNCDRLGYSVSEIAAICDLPEDLVELLIPKSELPS